MSSMKISSDGNVVMFLGGFNENGQPVERSKQEFPYSFDDYVLWRIPGGEKGSATLYTDNIRRFDHDRYKEVSLRHFGKDNPYWPSLSTNEIEGFLRDYCSDKKIRLVLIMECCNNSSGEIHWRLDFASTPIAKNKSKK